MAYALLTLSLLAGTVTYAGEAQIYQLTGPLLEVRDNFIVLQAGGETWEIARDFATRGGLDLTPGDKVTVQFTMNAQSIIKE